jgi:predicted transcriptional regulator
MIRDKIMAYLQWIGIVATTEEIAREIGESKRDTQAALHQLDDEDLVIMRNGWYLASKKGMQYRPDERGP